LANVIVSRVLLTLLHNIIPYSILVHIMYTCSLKGVMLLYIVYV